VDKMWIKILIHWKNYT